MSTFPSVVGGASLGNPMNLAVAIAVHASLSKELCVQLWPKPAGWFGLEAAPPLRISLQDLMADKEPLWKADHGLAGTPYAEVSSWAFADLRRRRIIP